MNAAVEALEALLSRFFDISLDRLYADLVVVAELNALSEELLGTALLFKTLIYIFPCAVFFGIYLAFTVFRAAALTVYETLGAVNYRRCGPYLNAIFPKKSEVFLPNFFMFWVKYGQNKTGTK